MWRVREQSLGEAIGLGGSVLGGNTLEGGDSGSAVSLDTEVIAVHVDSEEAVLTPVVTPGVATNPVLLSLRSHTVTNDGDFVVNLDFVGEHFGVDATSVGIEFVGGLDTASDGSVPGELSLHLVGSGEGVVLGDVVLGVFHSSAAREAIITERGRGPEAVTAEINVGASTGDKVVGGVLLAGRVGNTEGGSVKVDFSGVTTVARATSVAVDDSLGVEADGGGEGKVGVDVESISEGGGGALSPAGSTVSGDVLVLVPGKVVSSVVVSPVDSGGNIEGVHNSPGAGSDVTLTFSESRLGDTASLGLVLIEEILSHDGVGVLVLGLGHVVDNGVVSLVVLLFVSGGVLNSISPGVERLSPVATGLDGDVVLSLDDTDETIFTPVGTPGVSDSPERSVTLNTPSNNGDDVDNFLITSQILVDSTGVVLKGIGDGDVASNGSSGVDFSHHSGLTLNVAPGLDVVLVVLGGDVASFTGFAITAETHGGAAETVVKTTALVNSASLVGDVVLVNPLVGVVGGTTVASHVVVFAGDEDLGSDLDIGPRSLSGDLDTIGEGGGGGESPAGTTVLGQVLVSCVGEVVNSLNATPVPGDGELLKRSVLERSRVVASKLTLGGFVAGGGGVVALGRGNGSENGGGGKGLHEENKYL